MDHKYYEVLRASGVGELVAQADEAKPSIKKTTSVHGVASPLHETGIELVPSSAGTTPSHVPSQSELVPSLGTVTI